MFSYPTDVPIPQLQRLLYLMDDVGLINQVLMGVHQFWFDFQRRVGECRLKRLQIFRLYTCFCEFFGEEWKQQSTAPSDTEILPKYTSFKAVLSYLTV